MKSFKCGGGLEESFYFLVVTAAAAVMPERPGAAVLPEESVRPKLNSKGITLNLNVRNKSNILSEQLLSLRDDTEEDADFQFGTF